MEAINSIAITKEGMKMNEKLFNMIFKIGLLLIGVAFLVVYYFHSQNGRFYHLSTYAIMDTRSGVIYHGGVGEFQSVNPTNGKVTKYDGEVKGDWTYRQPDVTAAPAPAPPPEDSQKGKK